MEQNLISDFNLSGYTLEFMAKILLRRFRKNNFIFQMNQFASIQEIVTKYRLDISKQQWLLNEKIRTDLVEFVFTDLNTRKVTEIKLYEVKVNRREITVPDMTRTSFEFYSRVDAEKLATVDIVHIQIYANWNFTWRIIPFLEVAPLLHVYTSNWKKSVKERIYS